MFEVELLGLLNRYKKSENKEEKSKLKTSIIKLINESEDELETFLKAEHVDDETKEFLNSMISKNQDLKGDTKKEEPTEELDDNTQQNVDVIMDYYKKWLDSYHRNSEAVSDQCSKIIKDIMNLYIVNNFVVLEQILKLEDTEDFEKFKNHLKNNIRAYYGQKINEYFDGTYKELGFFAKRKKRAQIKQLVKEIGKYQFNPNKIREVLS